MTENSLAAQDRTRDDRRDLDSARRVLTSEGEALAELARCLDGHFIAALDLLAGVTGRVVVSGMGKSGHIARKIAATLASTGMPAQFVHPGEASHGDLGMVAPGDAVIALSNSGKTPELTDIVAYTRRRSIPLIAITARAGSPLDEAADVTLVLPDVAEACPMGLAPTTSTTMMLALGDALAVALLERSGFTSSHFRDFHPGGALGRKLLRVSDLMHVGDELPLCQPATAMSEVILIMTEKTFGCIGVVGEGGELLGIVTDGDLRRHMESTLLSRNAGEVMTPSPKTIRPQALAAEAVGSMNANSITSLFVVEEGRPVGIVRLHDCLRADV
jgi:arabinose-5-phosphate isomerase